MYRFFCSDLKTENIFVTFDSHSEVKRLTIGDFDSAKRVQTQNVLAKTTIGTPGYMAPVRIILATNIYFLFIDFDFVFLGSDHGVERRVLFVCGRRVELWHDPF